ncbi:MAG: RluA family pseudouridine synthase [Simkania sp.]|nr:RluA family pseudouridine synthase [Simkania sp.]
MKYKVLEEEGSLLNFLKTRVRGAPSVKAIKRALEARACLVNGKIERFGSRSIKKNDIIEFLDSWKEEPEESCLVKLFEDEHLLVINKPVGWVCDDLAMRKALPEYGGRLWLAHRLDKETSGVLLVTKSLKIKELLIDSFKKKKVDKVYLAVVHGSMLHQKGVIDSVMVVKKRLCGQTLYGSVAHGNGQRAITYWKVLEKRQTTSLIECKPITGRTHQIRVHLSSVGHPILGDLQYGRRSNEKEVQRCLLHAFQLAFAHPITGEQMLFEAPIPKEILDGATD